MLVWVRRHPLSAFFALAFGISWSLFFLPEYLLAQGLVTLPSWFGPIEFVAFFGPLLAALFMACVEAGWPGVRAMLSRLVRWRVGVAWYAVAILGPLTVLLAGLGIVMLLGGTPPGLDRLIRDAPSLPLLFLGRLVGYSVLAEEPGWRGFAQPELQARLRCSRYAAVWTAILVGLAWGSWYAPNLAIPGTTEFVVFGPSLIPIFVLVEVGWAFLATWIFNRTGGSALLAGVVFHAALNLWTPYLCLNAALRADELVPIDPFAAVILCATILLVASGLTVATKGRLGLSVDAVSGEMPTGERQLVATMGRSQ